MTSFLCRALASAFVAATLLSSSSLAVESAWIGAPTGNWSDPSNWSTGVVPNTNTTDAQIDANSQQDSTVVLDQNATIRNLVVDAGDTLNLDPSRVLTANSVTIAGETTLASTSQLRVSQNILIEPTATLSLADGAQIARMGNAAYVQIWNQGRFEGAGGFLANEYRYAWFNEGSVAATVPGKELQIRLYGTTSRGVHLNEGELLAENGGTLRVTGSGNPFFTPLENSNGVVEARGDSTVRISTIRLVGGRVFTSSVGGVNEGVVSMTSTMLENVILEGNIALSSVTFSDRVINNTHINSGGGGYFVEGYATISGNGSIDLNGGAFNVPGASYGGRFVGTPGFVNDVNHTIRGPGIINSNNFNGRLAFENRGLMESDRGTLQFNLYSSSNPLATPGLSINSGTLRAKNGGNIEILDGILANSSGSTMGLIEVGVDSTLTLGLMTLRGGVLRAVAPEEGSSTQPGKVIAKTGTLSPLLEDIRLEGRIGDTPTNSWWRLAGRIENIGELSGRLFIDNPTTLTGGGVVSLGVDGQLSLLTHNQAAILVNEDNLIHGAGIIGTYGNEYFGFINRSVVQADIPDATLLMNPYFDSLFATSTFINSGEFKAINGGKLVISGPIVNHQGSDLGTIHAGDGSEVTINQVEGGVLSTTGTGRIVTTDFNSSLSYYFTDIHNQGTLEINATYQILGKNINDGTVTQNNGATVYSAGPFVELAGNGVWGTPNSSLAIEINSVLFLHGPQHTIQGGGNIHVAFGSFINRGTVVANGTMPLTIQIEQGKTLAQQGTMFVPNDHEMNVQVHDERFVNEALIDVRGEFLVHRANEGSLDFVNADGATIALDGTFRVDLSDESSGQQATLWNEPGATILGAGSFDLVGTDPTQGGLLRNSGMIRPEGNNSATGQLLVHGDFLQDATGILELDLGGNPGTGLFDSIAFGDDNVSLGGTLDISLIDGYDPSVGESFEIVTSQAGSVLDVFDSLVAPALSGRWWSLEYFSDRVLLHVAAITADFDGNGYVDQDDMIMWQDAYTMGTGGADADGDGDSDGQDFLHWQRQFGSGIAPVAEQLVPEPSSLVILLAWACFPMLLARRLGCRSYCKNLSIWTIGYLMACLVEVPNAQAVEAEWIGGQTGTWSDPANWTTGLVPDTNMTNVTIDDNPLQDSVIVLDQDATIQNLVVDAGDLLNLDPSRTLIANSMTIAGEVSLANLSHLRANEYLIIDPAATLSLDIGRVDEQSPETIWNQGRIEGSGALNCYAFINEGFVVANLPGILLQLDLLGGGGNRNGGELVAENGGLLRIVRGNFLDNSNGIVEARGDSTVELQGVRLVGGRVSTSNEGGINEGTVTLTSVKLDNVTLEGNVNSSWVTFSDRVINNSYLFSVEDQYVEGYSKITGNGSLNLNGKSIDAGGPFGGATPGFVNDVNHTIRGPGEINSLDSSTRLAFENRGLIETTEGTLQINLFPTSSSSVLGSSINSGQIRAVSGGTIEILGANLKDTLMNSSGSTPGLLEAGVDSTVALGNMVLRGGTLRSISPDAGSSAQPGKLITSGTSSATLENVRLEGKIGDIATNSRWNLAGTIENTGILTGKIFVAKPTTLTGGGEIKLEPFAGEISGIQSAFNGIYDPLVNEDNFIHGAGNIGFDLAFVNRSIVQADVNNGTLGIAENNFPSVITQPIYNSGEMRAINGGILAIKAEIVNFEGSNLGTIHAGNGSEVFIFQVSGGILGTAGSGRIIAQQITSGEAYLSNVHNQGLLHTNTLLHVRGRITNDGTVIHEQGTAYFGDSFLELTGNGVWQLGKIPPSSFLPAIQIGQSTGSSASSVFMHSATHTIQGGGTITVRGGSRFINRGTLIANSNPTLAIILNQGAVMQQLGSLIVENSRTMEVQVNADSFLNQGIIDAAGTFRLKRMDFDTIEFRNAAGAELHLSSIFEVSQPSPNTGNVSIWNQSGALIEGHGNINLYRPNTTQETLFRNSGILRPGGDENQLAKLSISGNFQQESTGVLEIELGGTPSGNDFGALHITNGQAILGGSLDIVLVNGFEPTVGDSFEILTNIGGNVLGSFETINVPALAGRWWSLDYLTDKVLLNVLAITADFDQDGDVDGRDLLIWQRGGSPNGSNSGDLALWQTQYGSVLPLTATANAVPEPASLTLYLLGIAIIPCMWRSAITY